MDYLDNVFTETQCQVVHARLSLAPTLMGATIMDPIAKLKKERRKVKTEGRELINLVRTEKRDYTDDEWSTLQGLNTKADELADQIAVLEERDEVERKLCSEDAEKKSPSPPHVSPIDPNRSDDPPTRRTMPATARSHTRLKAFTGPNGGEQAYRAGMWLKAVVWGDTESREWCQHNGLEIRAMSSTTNTAGGALIFDEFRNVIIDLAELYGVFRQYAEVVPMGSDTLEWPRVTGGVTSYFVAESTAPTESEPAFDTVALAAKELATLTLVPRSLSDDSVINLADLVARKIALAFATKEDQCGFIGDGTATYAGMHGAAVKVNDGNHAGSIHTALAGNIGFNTFDMVDFESCAGKLPAFAGIQPAWFISKIGWAESMQRLADAAGGNTKEDIEGGSRNTFLGYPVVFSQILNTTSGDEVSVIKCLFGDLSMAATLGDRRVMTVESDGGGKYFEKRQTAIQGIQRFDLNVHDLGDSTNAGPIIALKTPGA